MKHITDKTIIANTGVTAAALLSASVKEIITPAGTFTVSCWKGSPQPRLYVRGKFIDRVIVTTQVTDPIDGLYPGIDFTVVGDKITEMFVW